MPRPCARGQELRTTLRRIARQLREQPDLHNGAPPQIMQARFSARASGSTNDPGQRQHPRYASDTRRAWLPPKAQKNPGPLSLADLRRLREQPKAPPSKRDAPAQPTADTSKPPQGPDTASETHKASEGSREPRNTADGPVQQAPARPRVRAPRADGAAKRTERRVGAAPAGIAAVSTSYSACDSAAPPDGDTATYRRKPRQWGTRTDDTEGHEPK